MEYLYAYDYAYNSPSFDEPADKRRREGRDSEFVIDCRVNFEVDFRI